MRTGGYAHIGAQLEAYLAGMIFAFLFLDMVAGEASLTIEQGHLPVLISRVLKDSSAHVTHIGIPKKGDDACQDANIAFVEKRYWRSCCKKGPLYPRKVAECSA